VAITQTICTSFKSELLGGIHDLDTDTIKIALYTSSATLGASTTQYSSTNEVASGLGYTTGGNTLTGASITTDGTTAVLDFSDTSWANASFTARGALVYNSSKSNRALAVFDFGSDQTGAGGSFTIQFPSPTATTGLVRLA